MPLILSTVQPDHDDIRTQLETYLSTIDSWKGVVDSQTGQGILNMLAAIGAYSQATIRRNYQDAFPETVVSDEASYAIAQMQGVRLTRKLPASATATLTSTIAQTIPAYSVFQGSGSFFFNRSALFLPANTPVGAVLYEGKIVTHEIPGINQDFAMFVSQETAFAVSDVDVLIQLDTTPMERATSGIWTLKNQVGFVDSTLPDGKFTAQFGNATYGGRPDTTQTLTITYAVTTGSEGNGLETLGKSIVAPDFAAVTGSFTSSPTGGADERPALSYKNLSAPTFGVFDSAVTRQQYITTALSYPGVIDVITFAQREVNPSALEWHNLIKVVLLTSSVWTQPQKDDFLAWYQARTAYAPHFYLEDPVAVNVDVLMEIYCFNWVNSTQAKLNAQAAIEKIFTPRAGILNYDLHLTDLTDAVMKADKGIEYIVLRTPAVDVLASAMAMDIPTLVEVVGGGTLPDATTYSYGVAVTTASGIVTVKSVATITTTALNNQITVSWTAYPGATSYQLYRRTGSGALLQLYTGTALTFTDTGAVTPAGAPPPRSTVPVRYLQLGTLEIIDRYSTRSNRI